MRRDSRFGGLARWLTGLVVAISSESILRSEAVQPLVAPTAPGAGATFFSMIRVLGAFALVLAVFFGGLWVWRNWQRLAVGRPVKAPRLSILEGRSLGQRQSIFVIGYEQQRMLVATSPSGVTLLTQLPPEQSAPEVAVADSSPSPVPAFGALLLRAIAHRS